MTEILGNNDPVRRAGIVGCIIGAMFLWVAQSIAVSTTELPYIGEWVYNYYYLSILEGRLDVPIQIIGLEGHYTSDGRAFVYHGLSPLLIRAVFSPFVDLTAFDLRYITIWFGAVAGTIGFYLTLLGMLRTVWPENRVASRASHALIWILLWYLAPGLLLVSNASFFHEPIAMAFACLGLFVFYAWRLVEGEKPSFVLLLLMAILAGLAVHSRPHVAVGMYAVMLLALGWSLKTGRQKSIPSVLACLTVLGAFGLLYMQMNALRFGSALTVDGSIDDGEVLYGFVFWGEEKPTSIRFIAVQEYGRFHLARVPYTSMVYLLSNGPGWGQDIANAVRLETGAIRLEAPLLGFISFWAPWYLLMLIGVFLVPAMRKMHLLLLVATLPAFVFVLCYPTVTARYRVELWPIVFPFAAAAMVLVLRWLDENAHRDRFVSALLILLILPALPVLARYWPQVWWVVIPSLIIGLGFVFRWLGDGGGIRRLIVVATIMLILPNIHGTTAVLKLYANFLNWEWGTQFRSYEDCEQAVLMHKNLDPARLKEFCPLQI